MNLSKYAFLTLIFSTYILHGVCQIPNYVPLDSLELWFSFSGNPNDESVNGYNGNIVGNVVLDDDRFNSVDSAYSFDGNGSYIEIGDVNEIEGISQQSISYWIKPLDMGVFPPPFSDVRPIISKWFSSTTINTCSFNNTLQGDSITFVYADGANLEQLHTKITFGLNQWTHICSTFDSGYVKVYFNGELVDERQLSITTIHNSNQPFKIGDWYYSNNSSYQTYDGVIDDLGVWSRPLTSCEIQDLYNAQLNSVDSSITQLGATLTANQNNANYQWYDCEGNNILPNDTLQSYTATNSGMYNVVVDLNGCVVTSECLTIDFTGIDEVNSDIKIYPNPVSSYLHLKNIGQQSKIQVLDIHGKEVLNDTWKGQVIDVSTLDNGVYFLVVGTKQIKFLVSN